MRPTAGIRISRSPENRSILFFAIREFFLACPDRVR